MEGTMKQLVLTNKGGPWELREVPIPKPGPGEMLVKVLSTSVCNQTDLNTIKALHPPHDHQITLMLPHHFRQWDNRLEGDPLAKYYNSTPYPREPFPTTMGHEGMGAVVEIGPRSVAEFDMLPGMGADPVFEVGDRVGLAGTIGGLGEYIVSPFREAVKIPDNLTNDEASLTEPAMILWGMCRTVVNHNDTVCIFGQGALGLLATQWARIFGAKTIITTDPLAMKREKSKEFGADYVIDPTTQNVTAEVEKITGGTGCNAVIDCAGVPDTISNIPYVAGWGAKIGCIGACCVPVLLDWSYIHFKGMLVYSAQAAMASMGGSVRNMLEGAMKAMSTEKEKGTLHLADMITHRPSLTVKDIDALFKEIDEQGSVIKAVINP